MTLFPGGHIAALVLAVLNTPVQSAADRAQEIFDRAVADFRSGRVAESVSGFDRVVALLPAARPHLWERGIALYYAGRYQDCREQFESHRTVNPNDVENAVWHFLCVARAQNPEKAREALLPVGPDARVPMREIYEMFRGALKPDEVLAAAGDRPEGQFYAQLYLGLYYEAVGNDRLAREHITSAAADRFKPAGGYMHDVARVHLTLLERRR
jgi:lipoprotein NlpI